MKVTCISNDTSLDWGATGKERIAQNALNILRTRHFEVPFLRELGISPDFLDDPAGAIKTDFIRHVTEAIESGEPRATVIDVRIESCDADGTFVIAVDLEV